jgi:hypothetical protein
VRLKERRFLIAESVAAVDGVTLPGAQSDRDASSGALPQPFASVEREQSVERNLSPQGAAIFNRRQRGNS